MHWIKESYFIDFSGRRFVYTFRGSVQASEYYQSLQQEWNKMFL